MPAAAASFLKLSNQTENPVGPLPQVAKAEFKAVALKVIAKHTIIDARRRFILCLQSADNLSD
jgi:hypothetical protein